MMRIYEQAVVILLSSTLMIFGLACGEDDGSDAGTGAGIDAPCDDDSECEDGLICDMHDGAGSCQEAHGH